MCDKAILENSETLISVPDRYKNQEMCNKADSHALEFVSGCFMTQEICDKVINAHPFTIQFLLEC